MILKNNAILSSLPLFFHDSPQLSVISDFSGHPIGSPLYISLLSNQFLRCLGVNRFEDGRFSGKINDSERIRSMFVPGIWLWFKVTTETRKVTERKRNNRLATNVNGRMDIEGRNENRKRKQKKKKRHREEDTEELIKRVFKLGEVILLVIHPFPLYCDL